jgi:hypothetical protein
VEAAVTYLKIPPTLRNYVIPQHVLDKTCAFLRERGERGVEGVVLWLGEIVDDETGSVLGAYVPEQIAHRSELGVAVEVTQEGLTRLIAGLPESVFVLIRVHSHPTNAFHSDLDDHNMLISHANAISIVVPDFAQEPIVLERCSVNELHHDEGWVELNRADIRARFRIVT